MKWRHLIIIVLVAAAFFSTAGYAFGNNENDQATLTVAAEPAPTLEDRAQFEQLAAVLYQSTTGSYLLGLREAYQVTVRFETGQGSSFNQAANRILLETNRSPVSAALLFAHEMNHAQTFHEGRKPHRKSDSRQAYIDQMLWDEVKGMAVSVQVKMELEENGFDVADVTLPFEDDYRQAYQVAVEQARLSSSSTSTQQLKAVGIEAGEQALYDAYASGQIRTSNTHETYPDYYGRLWDEANPIWTFVSSLFS